MEESPQVSYPTLNLMNEAYWILQNWNQLGTPKTQNRIY